MKKSLCCLALCFAFSGIFTYSMEVDGCDRNGKSIINVLSEDEQNKLNAKYITRFGSGKSEIFAEKIIPLVQLSAKCVMYKTTFIESLNETINKDWEKPITFDEAINILKKIDEEYKCLRVLLGNWGSQSLISLLQKNPEENVLAKSITLFIDYIVGQYKKVSANSIDTIEEKIKENIKNYHFSDEFSDSIHEHVKNEITQQNWQPICTQIINVDCDKVTSLKLSSDGKLLAVGIAPRKSIESIIIYNSKTGDKLYELQNFDYIKNKFEFNGKNVFYLSKTEFVLIDLHTENTFKFNLHCSDRLRANETKFNLCTDDNYNDVMNLVRMSCIKLWWLSPDGKYLAIVTKCSDSKSIQLWKVTTTGELVKTFENYGNIASNQLKFSPDSKCLSIYLDTVDDSSNLHVKVLLWDMISGKCKFTVNDFPTFPAWYGNSNFKLEFSPDSKLLAIAFEDFVRVISVKSGKILQKLKTNNKIDKLTFSDDNTYLLGQAYDESKTFFSYNPFNPGYNHARSFYCLYNIIANKLIKKFDYPIKTIRWLTKQKVLIMLLDYDIYKLNMATNECELLIKQNDRNYSCRPAFSANNKCIAINEKKCVEIYSCTGNYDLNLCLFALQNSNTTNELNELLQTNKLKEMDPVLQQFLEKKIFKKISKNTHMIFELLNIILNLYS